MNNNSDDLFKNKTRCNKDVIERGLDQINLSQFIIQWSLNYPFDRLWREKYKVSFNSSTHREVKIIDMLTDLGQDILYKNLKSDQNKYQPNRGEYFKLNTVQSGDDNLSDEEIQDSFDKLDIDNLEYDDDGKIII